ncbi:unnamed protein product [Gadus morhua 'NCC']
MRLAPLDSHIKRDGAGPQSNRDLPKPITGQLCLNWAGQSGQNGSLLHLAHPSSSTSPLNFSTLPLPAPPPCPAQLPHLTHHSMSPALSLTVSEERSGVAQGEWTVFLQQGQRLR